jgi:hypothetical protein
MHREQGGVSVAANEPVLSEVERGLPRRPAVVAAVSARRSA